MKLTPSFIAHVIDFSTKTKKQTKNRFFSLSIVRVCFSESSVYAMCSVHCAWCLVHINDEKNYIANQIITESIEHEVVFCLDWRLPHDIPSPFFFLPCSIVRTIFVQTIFFFHCGFIYVFIFAILPGKGKIKRIVFPLARWLRDKFAMPNTITALNVIAHHKKQKKNNNAMKCIMFHVM